jgi:uncharacterized membrane protein YkgB
MVVVVGLVFVTYFYYRSRERQMLIEKGLSGDEIKQFFEKKRDYFILFKIGIIAIFFGIGLGLGMISGDGSGGEREMYMPASIFIFTGIGFVVANLVGNKMRKQYKPDEV